MTADVGAATPETEPGAGQEVRPPSAMIGDGSPWPWDWARMSAPAAAEMWERLKDFVAFLDVRYAWTVEQLLPPCWAEHGALVEELTTLYWSRVQAFEGPTPAIDLAQTWHHQVLPGFYQRLRWWLGDRGGECRAGQHPAASPAAEIDHAPTAARYALRREELIVSELTARRRTVGSDADGSRR